jgi:hypothetical protein
MTATTVKIETWLPVFPGFYNTLFEPSFDSELEYLKEQKELPDTADEGDLLAGWQNAGYEQAVVKCICESLTTRRHNHYFPAEAGIINCRLQKVVNPKEYNFGNDSANVEFEIDMELFAPWIRDYLKENATAWAKHLVGHYKSCDGFISFYPYGTEVWAEAIESMLSGNPIIVPDFRRYQVADGAHILGRLLEFYLLNEDEDAVIKMYYDMTDINVGEFINLEEVKEHLKKE